MEMRDRHPQLQAEDVVLSVASVSLATTHSLSLVEWLLAGLIDRLWVREPPLDGEDDDDDADTGIDTTTPVDDNEDISSLTNQQVKFLHLSNF